MAAEKGRSFALYQGTTAAGTVVAGMRETSYRVNGEEVDITTKSSTNQWMVLLAAAGVKSLEISASGVFEDEATVEAIRGYAFAGTINAMGLKYESGDTINGTFQVTSFEISGAYNGAVQYAITLKLSGEPTFAAAGA